MVISVSLEGGVSTRGPATSGLPLCDFNTWTAPEGHLIQALHSSLVLSSTQVHTHTHTHTHNHTSHSDDICWWLDAEKCGCWGAIRGQKSNVTGDTAAIIKTYEERSDRDLASWRIFFFRVLMRLVGSLLGLMVIWCQGDAVQTKKKKKSCLLSHA